MKRWNDGSTEFGASLVEQRNRARNGQADHVEEAAFDAGNPAGGIALNPVSSGLVERFARADVLFDLGFAKDVEGDLRDLHIADGLASADCGDTSKDSVGAPAEKFQHAAGIFGVHRLTQNVAVAHNTGVGAENDERIVQRVERAAKIPDGLSLFYRQTMHVGRCDLIRQAFFIDVGRLDRKGEPGLSEQFPAARRSGSKNEHVRLRVSAQSGPGQEPTMRLSYFETAAFAVPSQTIASSKRRFCVSLVKILSPWPMF